jgi:putative transposase
MGLHLSMSIQSGEWRKGRKCVFHNYIHLVFLTKHRMALSSQHLKRLHEIFDETCKQMKCQLLDFEGGAGYVHLFISFSPTVAISILVGKLKGKSSYLLTREFSEELKNKIIENHLWADSYCTISDGKNYLEIITAFLQN